MTFIGRLLGTETRSLENPAVPITAPTLLEMVGGNRTSSGVWVGETSAQTVIAVYRAWSLIGGTIGSLPIRCFRGDPPGGDPWNGDQSQVLLYPGGRDPVNGLPVPGSVAAAVFFETLIVHLMAWGNAYVIKVRSDLGNRVVALDLLTPSKVQPRWGRKTSDNPTGKEFVVDDGHGGMIATPADVIHIRGMGQSLLFGLSPIAAARQALGMAIAAEDYGARLFGSGSLMSGILQTEQRLTADQAEGLKSRWQEKMAGLANSHQVAVLDSGAKWQSISIPPGDSQFIESRKFQVVEVARLYGIPPHLLGDVERSTSWGTGIEQQSLGFNIYTLRPYLARVEQALSNELLPRNVNCRFDVTEITRGDVASRIGANQTAILSGQLTPNEARAREGLPPLPGGDALLFPTNYAAMTAFPSEPPAPAPAALPAGQDNAAPDDALEPAPSV